MADQDSHYTHMHARYTHNADGTVTKSMVPDRESYQAMPATGLGTGALEKAAGEVQARPRRAMDIADSQS